MLGGFQNSGPSLGTLNIRGSIILGTQKGTIILTTTLLRSWITFSINRLSYHRMGLHLIWVTDDLSKCGCA